MAGEARYLHVPHETAEGGWDRVVEIAEQSSGPARQLVGFGEVTADTMLSSAYAALGVAGGVLGAYHGYRRNNSVGWAVLWGIAGSIVPFITLPISFAQGFGERHR